MATGTADFYRSLESIIAQPGSFSPSPYYDHESDSLIFYARESQSYARRINSLLTVFVSEEDGCLVGCKVKGVNWIVHRMDKIKKSFGIAVIDHKINLGILIEFALVEPPEVEVAQPMEDQLQLFRDVTIERSAIAA